MRCCADAGVEPHEVYEITVCGNVTMMQIALGIDPEPLSMAPFTSRRTSSRPRARLSSASPAPAGIGVRVPIARRLRRRRHRRRLLATGLTRDRRLRLFIDVGTNSEIALGSVERVLATAAPAGPAFEAAQIRCGMRAADGAIEGIKVDADGARARGDR